MSETQTLDRSIRTLDLRLAIGEHYGLDFERRVRESNSNSSAAVYFTRDGLVTIARDLGIDAEGLSVGELRNALRAAAGRDRRESRHLDWIELRAVVRTVGVDVPADAHGINPGCGGVARDSEPADNSAAEAGVWAGWEDTNE